MTTRKTDLHEPTDTQVKNTLRLSIGTAILTGIIAIYYSVLAYQGQTPLTFTSPNILAGFLTLVGLLSYWLTRRGRSQLSAGLIISTFALAMCLTVITFEGVDVLMTVMILIVTFGTATTTLPRALANRAILISVAFAVVFVLIAFFEPFDRRQVVDTSIWVISGAAILVYTILIVRQFPDYDMRTKLLLTFAAIMLVGGVTLISFILTRNRAALENSVFNELEAVRTLKAAEINDWITSRKGDALFARNLVVVKGTEGVNEGMSILVQHKDDPTHPAYQEAFARAEGVLSALGAQFVYRSGGVYNNIMMLDLEGDVLFSVDVASRGTNEAENPIFQHSLQEFYFGDLHFNPIYQEFELAVGVPILDYNGTKVGVLLFEINPKHLTQIMQERTGLGNSGETYLIGQDHLFRNDTRFLAELEVETTIMNPDLVIKTVAAESGLQGRSDTQIIDNYWGVSVLSSWSPVTVQNPTPLDLDGVVWVLVAEIDEAEVLAPVIAEQRNATLFAFGILGVVSLAAIGLAQYLVTPITRLTGIAEQIADGDLTVRATIKTHDEIGVLANTFNNMTQQLQETLTGLEQRVADRTRALEASSEISRRLSTILDQTQLVASVVEEVQVAFDYYHAHIYLFDEAKENLLMAGGTGEAGRILLERSHSIRKGKGLVGRAAETNEVVLVPDVSKAIGWLPNELLPETKAEIAVPIAIGNNVLGVLDVQENTAGGLTDEDANLLLSIANQTAIAVENTQSYTRTQQQAERETLINFISQKIQRAATIEDVLQVAVIELGHALNTPRANVQLALGAMKESNAQE